MRDHLRLVIIADSRHPVREPFAGGLESLTWHLVDGMRERGLEVSFFAGPGSDPALRATHLTTPSMRLSAAARADVSMPPLAWLEQHHAYLNLMLALSRREDVDVVHNNSLHYLPVAMAEALGVPMVTTLHTPPTPWLEPAIALSDPAANRFVAVSRFTAQAWRHVANSTVIPNGIDVRRWPLGPGGRDLVWFGRIAPEKAPHLAIRIARRAGRRLRLCGPIGNPGYWAHQVRPMLGDQAEYVGHLDTADLADLVGHSGLALVTPVWDEPYGLVAAEALACGTPVLGFDRGGLSEIVAPGCGHLVSADDVGAAADLVEATGRLDRRAARAHAVRSCSLDQMIDRYLQLYRSLRLPVAA
ncbi:MAG: glycosyltransferase [Actinomycetota bacterium]|nr:glycosyltransferase [Actinomycetota bacterium]